MSISDIPEFRVSSEISICQDSFCDNIPERFINVEIQIIHHNDNSINSPNSTQKGKKTLRKKYAYSSTILEKSKWPNLKISGPYIRESRNFRNPKEAQNNQNNEIKYGNNQIMLTASLTQSLQRISKEEEQRIANQSPMTRPLRRPCFSSYVTANKNLVIPTSNAPIKELPHPYQSKTMNNFTTYKHQNDDSNDPFMRFNGYSTNDQLFKTSTINTSNHFYPFSAYQTSSSAQNHQKGKNAKKGGNSSTPTTKKTSKAQKNTINPTITTTKFDTIPSIYNYESDSKSMMLQQTVPVIFRTEMRKKTRKESMNNRPYFTTCQEPLSKRPSTLNEMRSSTSHII